LAGVAGFGLGSISGFSTILPMFLRSCIFCIASGT
jgi:predicted oxidoreductase